MECRCRRGQLEHSLVSHNSLDLTAFPLHPVCFTLTLVLILYVKLSDESLDAEMILHGMCTGCELGSVAPAAILLQRVLSHSLVVCDSRNVRFTGSGVVQLF